MAISIGNNDDYDKLLDKIVKYTDIILINHPHVATASWAALVTFTGAFFYLLPKRKRGEVAKSFLFH